jgi:hypothetical protein
MNSQPNNPQAVVHNINNTNGNNYVNHALPATSPGDILEKCPKEQVETQNIACSSPLHTLDSQNNIKRLPVLAHLTSNNQTPYDQMKYTSSLDDPQSQNKEILAGLTKVRDIAPIS